MARRDLGGSVAVVTGGARGIGLAVAAALMHSGARVAMGDLDAELVAARAQEIGAVGMALDVREEASFAEFLDDVVGRLGPIDILVNSAGLAVVENFTASSAADHQLQVAVNLSGVIRGMHLALPSMIERRSGRIINIASAAALIPAPGAAVYSATKRAVLTLTEMVRIELRGTGVHATAVLPTFVPTEMAAGLYTRGVPKSTVDMVASTVVRVLGHRRPPSSVTVPRWLAVLGAGDALAPGRLRDLARRLIVVRAIHDSPERAAYERRIARQAVPGEGEVSTRVVEGE